MLTSANAQGGILGIDSLLVILKLVRGDIEGKMVANEASNAAYFDGSEFSLTLN